MKIKKIVEGVVLVVAIGVFCVAGYKLYSYMDEARKESAAVNMLSDNAVKIYTNPIDSALENANNKNGAQEENRIPSIVLDIDFDYLENENEDIKAWIYSPDTYINYPVLQSEDNDFYLHRLTDKTYNRAGSLFIDYRNSGDFSDYVTIIYGHHMKNDTMFGSISDYKKQEYYDEHPVMYLGTPKSSYEVQLIAGFVTKAASETYIIPENVEERDEFLNNSIKKSTFDSGIGVADLDKDDKLVMLSTCSYEYQNARYVVVGVLK